jgi:hypothetical protein
MKRRNTSLINQTVNFDRSALTIVEFFAGSKICRKHAKLEQRPFYLLFLIQSAPDSILTELEQFTLNNKEALIRDLETLLNAGYITRNDQKQYRATDEGRYLLRTCLPSFGIR